MLTPHPAVFAIFRMLDHLALEFSKDPQHVEKRLASRRCCVDSPLVQVKVDTYSAQLFQEADQVSTSWEAE